MSKDKEILFFAIKLIVVVLIMAALNSLHNAIYDFDMNRMTLLITGVMAWFIVDVGDSNT